MRFFISRMSTGREVKPCEEAFEITYARIDDRTVDDPQKLNMYADTWYKEGTNHRVEHGHIKRDFPGEKAWAIDIENLEELHTLYQKYGDLMLREHLFSEALEIRIVDDYL